MFAHVFVHFLIGMFDIFLTLCYECSLYNLDTSPWSDMWHANLFFQYVACLFIISAESFAEHVFLILMRSALSVFPVLSHAFHIEPQNK